MIRPALALLLLLSGGLLAVPGCDKTRGVAPLRDRKAECEELWPLCHDPGQALHGRYEECHEIGHEGDGKACLEVYAECKALCEHAPTGEGGAGGEGGGVGGEAGGAAHD